jgi:hypothetical protein
MKPCVRGTLGYKYVAYIMTQINARDTDYDENRATFRESLIGASPEAIIVKPMTDHNVFKFIWPILTFLSVFRDELSWVKVSECNKLAVHQYKASDWLIICSPYGGRVCRKTLIGWSVTDQPIRGFLQTRPPYGLQMISQSEALYWWTACFTQSLTVLLQSVC